MSDKSESVPLAALGGDPSKLERNEKGTGLVGGVHSRIYPRISFPNSHTKWRNAICRNTDPFFVVQKSQFARLSRAKLRLNNLEFYDLEYRPRS
jgi:hypothetical protein